jgi:RNA polymerase sigma-70 factor (ECF subfamily)
MGPDERTTDQAVLDLYDRSLIEVYRYASRLTGNDRAATDELVQDTFLDLVRHVRSGGEMPTDVGWLIVTCRHRFLDSMRAQRRRLRREEAAVSDRSRRTTGAVDDARLDALVLLPTDQRAALVLRYVDDLPVPEVARQLGRSVHATESLLARARAALRAGARATNETRGDDR